MSDWKRGIKDGTDSSLIAYFEPVITSATEYYPFGMMMRQASAGKYRYGFNGKENDNEVKGLGNQQDYGMRIYDGRLGRFLSQDPLMKKFPMLTPYQFASNTPIWAIDLDGLEGVSATNNYGEKQIYKREIMTGGINSFGIPTSSSTIEIPPNAKPVTQNMSDKDLYRFVVARMLAPGQFKINPDQYLDSKFFEAEGKINYYFSHLATATMTNSPEMRELTSQIQNKVVNGLFSDDAAMSNAAVTMIDRRTSFLGRFNLGKAAVELGVGSLIASGFRFALGRMSGSLESLGIPKGFGIMADPIKWKITSTTLSEQLAMKEAMSGGGTGIRTEIIKGMKGDPRVIGYDVSKYSYHKDVTDRYGNIIESIEIHYLQNNKTGTTFDYKFIK